MSKRIRCLSCSATFLYQDSDECPRCGEYLIGNYVVIGEEQDEIN